MHRLFDHNGILLKKSNVNKKALKLKVVDRLYNLLSQEEELEIRNSMFSRTERKLIIKYQVMENQCMPL